MTTTGWKYQRRPPLASGCRSKADIAALAVHLMTNTAVTSATFDIDGGQELVPG